MMRRTAPVFVLFALSSAGCASAQRSGEVPEDARLCAALTGDFYGYWTGAASGNVLKTREGALIEVPVVLDADLDHNPHWSMDATDVGEELLERSGHYNSSVWFVATVIEVRGPRVYITKHEDSYEDTLCLELVKVEANGAMRFQAHSFLADPGQGEREACLRGASRYDATLLLNPGRSDAPEFVESTNRTPDDWGAEPPGGFSAEPPDGDEGGTDDGNSDDDGNGGSDEGGDEL